MLSAQHYKSVQFKALFAVNLITPLSIPKFVFKTHLIWGPDLVLGDCFLNRNVKTKISFMPFFLEKETKIRFFNVPIYLAMCWINNNV